MKIVISSGHGKHVPGAIGPEPWGLNEVEAARLVVDRTAEIMRSMGAEVTVFHDNTSTSQSANLDWIVSRHNGVGPHDLDVSVHFNAYETTNEPMGTECLYLSQYAMADLIADNISEASGLINRGAKKRTDLKFLNATREDAVLVEVCFVDSEADAAIFQRKFNNICKVLAEAIVGEEAIDPPEPVPPSPAPDFRTLKKGMEGDDVALLQRILGLPADGEFGEITETQVEAFQAAVGLDDDGIVGPVTWGEIEALAKRVGEGSTGVSSTLVQQIVQLAKASPLMNYHWPDRGKAPAGYIPGMCLSFAATLERLYTEPEDKAAGAMAGVLGGSSVDALAWYASEFAAAGMPITPQPGVYMLRRLFVLMIGLGMRESSGRYCEGRDMSATNTAADTAEAALLQTSWNINTAHSSIPPLLDEFWKDPSGFLREFQSGVLPDASDLDCYGSGAGAEYQWLAKYSPLFAVLTTGVGLRFRKDHWGPIKRFEVTLSKNADILLKQVQELMERANG